MKISISSSLKLNDDFEISITCPECKKVTQVKLLHLKKGNKFLVNCNCGNSFRVVLEDIEAKLKKDYKGLGL